LCFSEVWRFTLEEKKGGIREWFVVQILAAMEWLERLKEPELFEIIEAALAIAASLHPHELRRRRDAFAEQLFAPQRALLDRPLLKPANRLMPEIAGEGGGVRREEEEQQKLQNRNLDHDMRTREEEVEEEEEEAVEEVEDEQEEDDDEAEVVVEERGRQEEQIVREQELEEEEEIEGIGEEEYDEAEALTDQMEEESRQILEINRIKKRITDMALDDDDEEEEEQLLGLLRTLQDMQISVEALKETEIGKEVNGLRKHSSKRICSLAKLLVKGWKDMVNDWVKSAGDVAAAAALAAGSSSGSTQDEHGENGNGLPSPPLEPCALLAATAHPASAELFEFLDEDWDEDLATDPDPNPLPCDHHARATTTQPHRREPELQQGRREIRASSLDTPMTNAKSQVSPSNKPLKRGCEHVAAEGGNAIRTMKVSRVSLSNSWAQHPVDRSSPLKGTSNGVVKKAGSQPLHLASNQNVHQGLPQALHEDMSVAARLEVAKRRLHERYQEEENAKKSRVVQVMDLTDLPKSGPNRAKMPKVHKPCIQNSKQQHHSRR
jgi:hypothetical protein